MDERIINFVKQRDKMLAKCSIEELRKFVKDNADLYDKEIVMAFEKAPDAVVEITLHKMIFHATNLPSVMRMKSAHWLISRGFDLQIR